MSTPALAGLPPRTYLVSFNATLPRFGEIRKASSCRLLPRLAVPFVPLLAGAGLQSRPGTSAAHNPG
jgi:hypothetical protein